MQLSGRHCFLLLFFFAGFFVHTSSAQQLRYAFKNYTPNDGLPSSEVHKVLQDAQHYMWFATDHGVCRFNGYEFKTFNLADNSILGLYEDYKKRIWAWSFSGRLFVFEDGKFEEYKWNQKLINAISPGVISALYLDSAGTLYVSASGPHSFSITQNGKIKDLVSIQDKSVFVFIETHSPVLFGFIQSYPGKFNLSGARPNVSTVLVVKLKSRELRITVPEFLLPERFRAVKISNGDILLHSFNFLIKIKPDGKWSLRRTGYVIYEIKQLGANYFFATDKGLVIEDLNGNMLETYFENEQIVSIAQDYEGGLWFSSTTKAVYYLNSSKVKHLTKNNVILDKKITALYPLADSSVLVGTNEDYIIRFKPFERFREINMFMRPTYSFYQDSDSRIFVGGPFTNSTFVEWHKVNVLRDGRDKYHRIPGMSNFVKKGKNLFVGLSDNIIEVDTQKDSADLVAKESFRVSRLLVDHNGQMIVGNIFGLWKFINGRLIRYDSTKPVLASRITDIVQDRKQVLYLGTRGKGLLVLQADTILNLNEDLGLISNNVRRIFIDEQVVWIATNKGISIVEFMSFKPFRFKIRNINVQDGLLSNEVNDIVKSQSQIIIATNNGVSYLDRDYFIRKQERALAFHLTGIKLNGVEVDVRVLKNLGFKRRNLLVTYEALKFNNPGKVNYRYRLSGSDSTWFYTNDLQLQFNPVPYGKFELQIQAKTELEDWSNSSNLISIPLVCSAPFWATVWFWVTAFAFILLLLILAFRKRIQIIRKRQKEDEELKNRIAESEQLALKSQMNPHFIFNSLNSIQQYVIDRDIKGANSFISGFSKLMRQTLDFSSKEKITLPEEIAYLKNYLELERMRMESKFDFTITVDTVSPTTELFLPPLMLQPYVENALRHGVRYLRDKAGHIHLSFIERDEILECIIEDNGIGRDKAAKLKAVNPIEYQSRGMSLTAERVELLNRSADRSITIAVKDLRNENGEPCGTSVSVKFPV